MSDFFTRLAERALGLRTVIEPRVVGLFTPVDEAIDSWTSALPVESFTVPGQLAIQPTAPPAMRSASSPEAQDTPAARQPSRPDHAVAIPDTHNRALRTYAVDVPSEQAPTGPNHPSGDTRAAVRGNRSSVVHGVGTADPVRTVINVARTSSTENAAVGRPPFEARPGEPVRLSTAQAESRVAAAPLHPSIVAAAGAARAGAPETRIEITIGRIDVRAPESRSADAQRVIRRREEPGQSLSDYLRGTRRPRGGR